MKPRDPTESSDVVLQLVRLENDPSFASPQQDPIKSMNLLKMFSCYEIPTLKEYSLTLMYFREEWSQRGHNVPLQLRDLKTFVLQMKISSECQNRLTLPPPETPLIPPDAPLTPPDAPLTPPETPLTPPETPLPPQVHQKDTPEKQKSVNEHEMKLEIEQLRKKVSQRLVNSLSAFECSRTFGQVKSSFVLLFRHRLDGHLVCDKLVQQISSTTRFRDPLYRRRYDNVTFSLLERHKPSASMKLNI